MDQPMANNLHNELIPPPKDRKGYTPNEVEKISGKYVSFGGITRAGIQIFSTGINRYDWVCKHLDGSITTIKYLRFTREEALAIICARAKHILLSMKL
jgi:hypothetical protein